MKQIFYTGDIPLRVVVIDGNFTEKHKKVLKEEEINKMKSNPKQAVFFRRYNNLSAIK